MLDSFSSLALCHFNGRADVLHQKGTIKCLGSVAEAVSRNDSLHLFFEKGGGSQTSKVAAKVVQGEEISREILFVSRHAMRCGQSAWEQFSSQAASHSPPHCAHAA